MESVFFIIIMRSCHVFLVHKCFFMKVLVDDCDSWFLNLHEGVILFPEFSQNDTSIIVGSFKLLKMMFRHTFPLAVYAQHQLTRKMMQRKIGVFERK